MDLQAAVQAFKYPSDPRRDTDCERELDRLVLSQLYDESLALLLLRRTTKEVGERALARLFPTPINTLPASEPSTRSSGEVDLAERAYG
jgi:hypothetical protein